MDNLGIDAKARSCGPTFAHRTRESHPSTSLRADCLENRQTRGPQLVAKMNPSHKQLDVTKMKAQLTSATLPE